MSVYTYVVVGVCLGACVGAAVALLASQLVTAGQRVARQLSQRHDRC